MVENENDSYPAAEWLSPVEVSTEGQKSGQDHENNHKHVSGSSARTVEKHAVKR